MGFGGSVQAMIDSLKQNARQRPSLRKSQREIIIRRNLKLDFIETKKLSPATRQHLNEKILRYKMEARQLFLKRALLLVATMLILALLFFVVLNFLQSQPDEFFFSK